MVIFPLYLRPFSSQLPRASVTVLECGTMEAAVSNRYSPLPFPFWNQRHGFFCYLEVIGINLLQYGNH